MSDALTQWFASMKTGTAKNLHEIAAALPGVRWCRVLEDPLDRDLVVVLADLDGETSPQQGGRGGDTDEGVPATRDERANGDTPAAAVAAARIAAAVEVQVERARDLAGNRLIRRAQSCEDCADLISGVPPALIASALGRDRVQEIIAGHTTERNLVNGAGGRLAEIVRGWGVDDHVAASLGALVEQHALSTLYEPRPLLPVALAREVQAVLA